MNKRKWISTMLVAWLVSLTSSLVIYGSHSYARIKDVKQNFNQLTTDSHELHNQSKELENNLSVFEKNNKALEDKIALLEKNNRALESKLALLIKKNASLERENDSLIKDVNRLKKY